MVQVDTQFSPILDDITHIPIDHFKKMTKPRHIYADINKLSTKLCVGLSFTYTHQQEWVAIPCDQTYNNTIAICEKTLTGLDRYTVQISLWWCPKRAVAVMDICAKIMHTSFDEKCLNMSAYLYTSSIKRFINHWLKDEDILVLKEKRHCVCYTRYHELDKNDPSYSILNSQPYKCKCDISDKFICFFPLHERKIRCPQGYIACDNHTCINIDNWKNNFPDCADKSDEFTCITICSKFTICHDVCNEVNNIWLLHQCSTDELILWSAFCDGIQHCINGFDELKCTYRVFFENTALYLNSHKTIVADESCEYEWSMCNNIQKTCFNIEKQCLFERDIYGNPVSCTNTEHLRNCHPFECPNHHKCTDSYCIPIHMVCDGIPDCPSAEDEAQCPLSSCPGLLRCKQDQICVHPDFICDQVVHCPSSFDDENKCETEVCPKGCDCLNNMLICNNMYVNNVLHLKLINSLVLINVTMNYNYLSNPHHLVSVKIILSEIVLHLSFIELRAIRFLNISYNNISGWPTNIFLTLYSLKSLDISHNVIPTISYPMFADLISLEILHIQNCHIETIEACSFCSLVKLEYLNIGYNSIKILKSNVFDGLRSLQYLSVVENDFEYIHTKAFMKLEKLATMETNNGDVCCFIRDNSICQKPYLECLYIRSNKIIYILLVIIATLIIINNAYAIVHNATLSKKNIHFLVVKALAIHEMLISSFIILILYIQTLPSPTFIFIKFQWFQSLICKINKIILIYSISMSKVFALVLAIDALILTKYVMQRQALHKDTILFMTFTFGLCFLSYACVFIYYVKNESIFCFPFRIFRLNTITVALCISWCLISLLFSMIILYCYIEVIKTIRARKKISHRNKLLNKSVILKSLILIIFNTLPTINLTTILFLQIVSDFDISFGLELSVVLICIPYNSIINAMLHSISVSQLLQTGKDSYFRFFELFI